MTKRYTILQKKLKELETELKQLFTFPPDNVFNVVQNNELYSEDIEQRILFLKGLLTAEIASNPKKPRHLEHIGKRLLELETAFHEWNEVISTASYQERVAPSACFCTESCLKDGVSGSDSMRGSDPLEEEVDGLEVGKERESEAVRDKVVELDRGEGEVVRVRVKSGRKRFCGGLLGVVIGLAVMGFVMLGMCPYMDQTSVVLVPT